MEKLLESIIKNPYIGAITLLISIISIPVAIYLYKIGNKAKMPRIRIMSKNLIRDYSGLIEDLNIKYRDDDIKNLTVTNVLIWNEGKETIDRSDLVTTDLLRLTPIKNDKYEPKILYHEVLLSNNSANGFKLTKVDNEVMIDFEYFDYLEGVIIQLIHTGLRSSDIKVNGVIKGFGKVDRRNSGNVTIKKIDMYLDPVTKFADKISLELNKLTVYLAGLISICVFLLVFVFGEEGVKLLNKGFDLKITVWRIIAISMMILSILSAYVEKKRKVPKKFELLNKHFDEY